MSHLKKLRSLFLQKNLISTMTNLSSLTSLVHLDISENRVRLVQGINTLPNLATLNLSKNFLETTESILHLASCPAITNVDLSNNELRDESVITSVLGKMPSLVATNTAGNPMVRSVAQFRKKCIIHVKKLRYMDRPVFENERAAAEAFADGGYEKEKEVKQEWAQKKRDEEKQSLQDFRDWQKEVSAREKSYRALFAMCIYKCVCTSCIGLFLPCESSNKAPPVPACPLLNVDQLPSACSPCRSRRGLHLKSDDRSRDPRS